MTRNRQTIYIIILIATVAWLVFLFVQKISSSVVPSEQNLAHTGSIITTKNPFAQNQYTQPALTEQQKDVRTTIQQNTEQYELSQYDATAVKELFSSINAAGKTSDNTKVLEYMYQQTKDEKVLKLLLQLLVDQYRFEQAYEYLQKYESTYYDIVDPHTALYILLNSSLVHINKTESLQKIQAVITYYHQFTLLSDDDRNFYLSLLALLQGDIQGFLQQTQTIVDTKYAAFVADTKKSISIASARDDLPAYYAQGLLSLDLMQYGYFKIAQQMAVRILLENDGYDLPYQVLAYSHFVLNNRERSIEYFHILLEQDTLQYQENYKLFLGIAYYRNGSYKDAVVYLSQLARNHEFRSDILRYLIAAYKGLGDIKNLTHSYQMFLSQTDVDFADFYDFFETALYKPLVDRIPYQIIQANEYLANQYIQVCKERLSEQENYICDYGQAGLRLYQQDLQKAGQMLLSLRQKINKSYIFAALGDYYHRQGNIALSQEMYTNAVALAVDEKLKNNTQQKLLQLLE